MKPNSEDHMNIIVRYCGLNPRAIWQELAEAHLKNLQTLSAIATARVSFMWQHGVKPAFRVTALLEVPGPDFHAEASDHTIQAALMKVIKNLERQIRSRRNRRADKRRTNVQLGLSPMRLAAGGFGSRA
jgi:ribosome-associated translation inhibitor RaiA